MARLVRRPILRRGMASGSNTGVIIGAVVAAVLIVGCLGVALLVALLMPALGQARDAAQAVQSQAVLREIAVARQERAIELRAQDDPQWPTFSIDYLRDEAGFSDELLASPFGPVPDGGEDYWVHPEMNVESIDEPGRVVAAYDRAMYATHRMVTVQMFDGTVEVMSIDEFDELASEPPNDSLELNLPARSETPAGAP